MKRFRNYKIISLLSTLIFLGGVKISHGAGVGTALWNLLKGDTDGFQLWLGNTILWVPSQLLRVAGVLFNYVMEYTIKFSSLLEETGVVNIGWKIFRDLSNLVFIFILLAIAIATILGIQNYGAKQLLVKVILVALLINFSLFTTKVIIDAANVFTVGFYNAILAGEGNTGITGAGEFDKGVSSVFAGALNLQTIFRGNDAKALSKDEFGSNLNADNVLLIALLGAILLIITTFIFLATSFLLMKRIVVLMFLMMISPLAFLGMILPATSGHSKQWWNMLFKEAFYAPVLMMFLWVVAKAITSDKFREIFSKPVAKEGFAALATGGDKMVIIFNFILIIGLLLASLISASKLGASGADGMISMGKKMQTWGQNKVKAGVGAATFGAGGRLARRTIGGTAQWGADKLSGSRWAAKGGAISKLTVKSLRGIGDSSFDARNTDMGKKMGLGEGIKGGYKTVTDKAKKAETAYAQSLTGDSKTQATDTSGQPIYTGTGTSRKAVMLSNTEAYSQKRGSKKLSGIWGTMIKGAAVKGRKQAGADIMAETTQKRNLKAAQEGLKTDKKLLEIKDRLRRAKDELEDAKEKGGTLTGFRKAVYSAEEELRIKDLELKEKIEEVKEEYLKAKGKTKVEKSKKDKEDTKDTK